jgi:hypothetical protein
MKKIFFFASFKSVKNGVGSEVLSGSGSAPKCHGSPTHWYLPQKLFSETFYDLHLFLSFSGTTYKVLVTGKNII